jgi:DNA processing protein
MPYREARLSGANMSVEAFRTISPQDLLGPLSELELKYAPTTLYVSGRLCLPLLHPRVAIVGTRQPSPPGRELATRIADGLASKGVTVVSGLARGVDTAAHRAALDADGSTIAVLGTPLSRAYPAENRPLQDLIMREQLAVSQFSDHHPVLPANFVLRNRTMALIADASVIIESGDSGGSLNQGWETLRLGRPLFIHEREFAKPNLQWPTKMARYGAIRFRESEDVLDQVPTPLPTPERAVAVLEAA